MFYKDSINSNEIIYLINKKLGINTIKKGRNFFILCPFHDEKSPSLCFDPNNKIFSCFGGQCSFGTNKNFIDLWSKFKNISIEDSIEEIGKMGYISLLNIKKKINKIPFFLYSLIRDIYQHNLFVKEGKKVLNYLKEKRKIENNLIIFFSLGCTIKKNQITSLLYDKNNEYSSYLSDSKIIWTNDDFIIDNFQEDRLIIPLKDNENNQICSFVTRTLEEKNTEKYRYLPKNEFYKKSSIIYNYFEVKNSNCDFFYLVEGFFDVISLYKKNIKNCLAILGTILSNEQLKYLKILKKKIIVFMDGDKAGKEASVNIIIKLLRNRIDCEIISNPLENDPDEICNDSNDGLILEIIKKKENPCLFLIENFLKKWKIKENPQRIGRFINEIIPIIKSFEEIVSNFMMDKISSKINMSKEKIISLINYWQPLSFNMKVNCEKFLYKMIKDKEIILICLCVKERKYWLLVNSKFFFFGKKERKIYRIIYNYYITTLDKEMFKYKNDYLFWKIFDKCYCPFFPCFWEKNINYKKVEKIESSLLTLKKFLLNYEKKK